MAYNPYNDLHGITNKPTSFDEVMLRKMKALEANRKDCLVKVKVKCGYAYTNKLNNYGRKFNYPIH